MRDIYPVTIIATRYGGVYEGGQYAAFACSTDLVPEEAEGDDTDAMFFWADPDPRTVGVGATPDAALAALKANLSRVARASGAPVEGMVMLPARPVPWLRDALDTEPLAAGLLIGRERHAEAIAAGWTLRPWYGSAREQLSGPKWWRLCEREPTGCDDE